MIYRTIASIVILSCSLLGQAPAELQRFELLDVFDLEYASDPRISPDGEWVVYVRNFMDIMKDRKRSNLWLLKTDGTLHRPLTTGIRNDSAPRWSPDGKRLLYASSKAGESDLVVRWMDGGHKVKLGRLGSSPSGLSWSPDGEWIAFSMLVREPTSSFAKLPKAPKGAEWAAAPIVIDSMRWRRDGSGILNPGFAQLFVMPAEGGSPRQITRGKFHHRGPPSWTPDSKNLVFSANRRKDWELESLDSEVQIVDVATGKIKSLTKRYGPDNSPVVSPDGQYIAYLGFDDKHAGYQLSKLHIMQIDGSESRVIGADLDRNLFRPTWAADGQSLWISFDDRGRGMIARMGLDGHREVLANDVGGTTLGRPYAGGSYSVARDGRFAYTRTSPLRPADVAIGEHGKQTRVITKLNRDVFGHKQLSSVEEIWCKSSHDGQPIQGWIVKPPGFDANKRYPLLLEIHGGPFANYGERFSAEIQLYAAAGYVVLYTNPRGSTSYGAKFGNMIHHAYPGFDYDDLMSCVDATIQRGYVDPKRLFVTGGSGGGVLTAWIVGKTHRFRAAVCAKPVINWYSFALASDSPAYFSKYWFPGPPWEHLEHYMKRSPISLVGNIQTPTMLLTGEQDWRTPISESEQLYHALKLRKIDTALVRIPGASHSIASRPSRLIAKVAHILEWFRRYDQPADLDAAGEKR
ncbi:MAG: S9 family peptidase [Planctomycetota bacterium]